MLVGEKNVHQEKKEKKMMKQAPGKVGFRELSRTSSTGDVRQAQYDY
jgi:hypothetical protein